MINESIAGYRIIRELGRGGMATVYLAEHELLRKMFAIKILHFELARNSGIRQRFIKEARIMADMSHTGIVKVNNLIDAGDIVAIIMEYIDGETLKEYVDRKKRLSDVEIKGIFLQMLKAVDYVHSNQIVHRDLKPANFMIDRAGQIKLMDFGIAKSSDSNSSDYTLTGTQMGTPMYMSPEQVKGIRDIGNASDIYSLGVVLWQMVSGKKPYDSKVISQFEMQLKILQESLPKTGTSWDKIISKATSKEISQRFRSINKYYSEVLEETFNNSEETVYDGSSRNNRHAKSERRNNNREKNKWRFILIPSAIVLALVSIIMFNNIKKDIDNDGIIDQDDLCPRIFGLSALNGCPDSDGDGIADKNDTCPERSGLAVFNGCPDSDGDGIVDKDDKCPELFGFYITGGCPENNNRLNNASTINGENDQPQNTISDRDNDGIVDSEDDCEDEYGYTSTNGCPDNDHDGIANYSDVCPDDFGPSDTNGCPDSDHDGVINKNDACPNEFGNNPNGCFYYKTITFYNKTSEKAWLAIGYYLDNDWHSIGWYAVESYSEFNYSLPEKFKMSAIYWYGKDASSGVWKGDYSFCVDPVHAFEFSNASSRNNNCTTRGFKECKLTSENTRITLSE
jgi:serine/threonine protein kinase/uncharacterized membrane protein